MDVGISLPTTSRRAWDPGLAHVARAAEREGAASLWVNDHLAMVADPASPYPYRADGTIAWDPAAPQLEALVALAQAAAVTERARIGTAVLVLPQRNPVELAKATASLDVLSGGRLRLGVGAGWLAEEMRALGHSFADRGRRMEEYVRVLRACWCGRPDRFDGEHVSVPDGLLMYPRPVREAGVPILVGGMSKPALRRAALLGDGWLAVADADAVDSAELGAAVALLEAERAAHGRGRAERALKINCPSGTDASRCAEATVAAAAAGFDEVILDVSWERLDDASELLRAALDAASDARTTSGGTR
ncbi:TIGR03619 family F420-dependent LLM class oxidoreductase [Streptomyces kanamyceticus]|uniref:TIGR03619 family F420-dependent LLM class oxidoreductase n=1 Tax=Streptomyces kanamyceticus TaxID=1967 RepID=A0A5J6GP88_STRKN|nr:TIGR03619 family F420-dependent LLM class oxidoreductase [Streptomyces kanamyceticus]QEU96204.1 TIGR03619 family F420-dependent LLM class oxidoreductase [Streptomyces kanamyceticus]